MWRFDLTYLKAKVKNINLCNWRRQMAKSHSPVETMLSVINFFGPEGFRYPVAENSGTVVTYLAAAILAKYQPFYCLSECHCRSCIQKFYVVLVTDYSSCWTFWHVWVLVIILVWFCLFWCGLFLCCFGMVVFILIALFNCYASTYRRSFKPFSSPVILKNLENFSPFPDYLLPSDDTLHQL